MKNTGRGDTSIRRARINEQPNRHDGPRINDMIDAAQVRLVDVDGEMVGVVDFEEALRKAFEAGLDLVEIAGQADPPVCKILDYGKFRYEQQKRQNEARKKQKVIDVKEIKVRPNIDDHDYEVKMRSAKRFLDDGDKVKVTLRFRGREMAHQDLGLAVLERIRGELDEIAKVEQMPKMEGRQAVMVLAPK
jgi:translation initiation factor IF-3